MLDILPPAPAADGVVGVTVALIPPCPADALGDVVVPAGSLHPAANDAKVRVSRTLNRSRLYTTHLIGFSRMVL
jgi:hypothetical protein